MMPFKGYHARKATNSKLTPGIPPGTPHHEHFQQTTALWTK